MNLRNHTVSKSTRLYRTRKGSTAYTVDYKNVNLLRHYIGFTGKILPRRVTKLTAKKHRLIASAILRARGVGLLPFVWLKESPILCKFLD
jgi:small subunit ribosomal protein S18